MKSQESAKTAYQKKTIAKTEKTIGKEKEELRYAWFEIKSRSSEKIFSP